MDFPTVQLEGGLFAADKLDEVATGSARGQTAADFGVRDDSRLRDEIAFAWSEALKQWEVFQEGRARLGTGDTGTSLTRDRWVIPLLSLLGFENVGFQRSAAEIDGHTYAISHRLGGDVDGLPIHIEGCGTKLDERPPSGRPRLSPHSLMQEYLNREEKHLWAIVTNGLRLRVLRDCNRVTRPVYLEFDLERMMSGAMFPDFQLFYRLTHRSRWPQVGEPPDKCLLENYYQDSIEQGGRARDRLRDGVVECLKRLGTGFLCHPANDSLRSAVRDGSLKTEEYYRELLKLVYRFLFLLVSEERRLVGPAPEDERFFRVYAEHYSIGRLRTLVERPYNPEDRHSDLWEGVKQTFRFFATTEEASRLGMFALDGDLFGPSAMPHVENACLLNRDFLPAFAHLALFQEKKTDRPRRVNYSYLNVEELGSVYESLLDFEPQTVETAGGWEFRFVGGDERRKTGSYYTHPSLVQELVEHALEPVMEDRLKGVSTPEERKQALLGMSVCDPAAGSGHFLLAAARRLGLELARMETGEESPPPDAFKRAVREVIRHCIYGVDRNPLAVDLCKVALWLEGHNRDLPLTFLDHRIKCGDSLVGVVDLKVLETPIPDEAYKRAGKDEAVVARAMAKRNREEASGQTQMFTAVSHVRPSVASLAAALKEIESLPESSPDDIRRAAQKYDKSRAPTTDWWVQTTAFHMWIAPFFAPMDKPELVPTTGMVRAYLVTPGAGDGKLVGNVWDIAQQHRFFHWLLEFPDVFAQGGFDCMLSNPPFLGGKRISTNYGDEYRTQLKWAFLPAEGLTDLCAFFLRRGHDLLRDGGALGMVASNTVAQGDTREGGLAPIVVSGSRIAFARRFVKWPGDAAVEVNLVAVAKTAEVTRAFLDGTVVDFISSRLDTAPECEALPLLRAKNGAFQGSNVRGVGFTLEPDHAAALLERNPQNSDCLFPYLVGDDLNTDVAQRPRRWIINFFDWPRSRAERYADLFRLVEEKVLPERTKIRNAVSREKNVRYFWHYDSIGRNLYETISGLQRVLVRSRVSELHMLSFSSTDIVFGDALVVFAFDDYYHFALLQSNVHESWVWKYASSLESRNRYTPTDCFETFPFPGPVPESKGAASGSGEAYYAHRQRVMTTRQLGLTKTYNLFHNPEVADADITRMRELHAAMDRAILACYGWHDIDAGHGFHKNDRGQTRYTTSAEARQELLRRLLDLNLRLAEEEKRSGGKGRSR
jgi:hypothetical protein